MKINKKNIIKKWKKYGFFPVITSDASALIEMTKYIGKSHPFPEMPDIKPLNSVNCKLYYPDKL